MHTQPTFDQLVSAARIISEQNTHGLTVAEYDGRTMTDGTHVVCITAMDGSSHMFRIAPSGAVL